MIIKKTEIIKFRGFEDVEFKSQLTIIADQNGAQKTTVLAMLIQSFTINSENPMRDEKSLFVDTFKLA